MKAIENKEIPAGRLRVVCAWCGRDMGEKPGVPGEPGAISHGLCDQCDIGVRAELEQIKANR
jgi:hypothetical protein